MTIKELEKKLLYRVSDQDTYEWTFEIYVAVSNIIITVHGLVKFIFCIYIQATQILSSVVLFDTLSFEFQISLVMIVSSDEKQKYIGEPTDRFEYRLNQKIEPSEKILVKVQHCLLQKI